MDPKPTKRLHLRLRGGQRRRPEPGLGPIELLGRLGRAVTILLYLKWQEAPQRACLIASRLRLGYHTVLTYLHILFEQGFVSRCKAGWSLARLGDSFLQGELPSPAETGRELASEGQKMPENDQKTPTLKQKISKNDQNLPTPESKMPENDQNLPKNAENSRFSPSITTIKDSDLKDESLIGIVEAENAKNEHFSGKMVENKHFLENLKALGAFGITPNERTRLLASRAEITPQVIQAHALQLEAQLAAQNRRLSQNLGLLISVLESGAPAPALNAKGHLQGCGCPACDDPYRGWGDIVCPDCHFSPCVCDEPLEDELADEPEEEDDSELDADPQRVPGGLLCPDCHCDPCRCPDEEDDLP